MALAASIDCFPWYETSTERCKFCLQTGTHFTLIYVMFIASKYSLETLIMTKEEHLKILKGKSLVITVHRFPNLVHRSLCEIYNYLIGSIKADLKCILSYGCFMVNKLFSKLRIIML